MNNGELQEWLARWPSDAEIVSRGEDGVPCCDVHHDTIDEPMKSRVSSDKVVLFIHGLGPGDLPAQGIPTLDDLLIMPDGERIRIRDMANEKFGAEVYRGACERGIIQWEPSI